MYPRIKNFPTENYNVVNSKKIDQLLHPHDYKNFKFYLLFFKFFKKIFNNTKYFLIFINFVNCNVFANKFYFNRKRKN